MTTNQPPALYRRDPRRAFLSAYFEDAYRDAFTACKEVLNRGVLWMACLVRETVPDATSVTVDVAEQKLLSVHAGDRKVWEAGKDQGPLTQPHVDDIEDVLRDVLDFGRTPVAFTEVGWQPTSDTARYGIALPDTSQPGEPTAARVGAAHTATPAGLLEVIAALEPGDASFTVEGLPAYARETRDRVRAALLNAGYDWPQGRLTVHVVPNCKKASPTFDLAAACAILVAAGRVDHSALDDVVLLGVLGLDGRVCGTPELPGVAQAVARLGCRKLIVPETTAPAVAQAAPGVEVIGARTVGQAVDALNGKPTPEK